MIAVLDLFMVGQELAAHWPSYRERIADALMEKAGGEGDARDEELGVVSQSNEEGEQASGALLARLEAIRASVITGPEQRTADECIAAAKEVLGCGSSASSPTS